MKKFLFAILMMVTGLLANAAEVPSFPGGEDALNQFLSSNIKYPAMAQENGIEGVVTVGFIVKPDGSLSAIKVLKRIDPDLEKEAIRVVNAMPAWIPAEKNGTPIEAPSQVEVSFILE